MGGVPSNEVLVNDPIIPVPQSIYEPDATTQRAPLGTRLRMSDRTYYYAQASASVAGGTVMCAPSPVASYQSGILLVASTAIGAKVLSVTSTGVAAAANTYAEGFFGVASGTNAGELYRIKRHSAASGGIITDITLYDGLNTAITSGSVFFIIPNNYALCNVGSEALNYAVGVAPVNVTSGAYFWLQTWGNAAPTHVGASVAAGALRLGTTGSVNNLVTTGTLGSTGFAAIDYGFAIGKNSPLAATAGQANPVYLTIQN